VSRLPRVLESGLADEHAGPVGERSLEEVVTGSPSPRGTATSVGTGPSELTHEPRPMEPMPGYFPHVDGLRALAVLAVMAYHIHPALLRGGFAGVDVFFVISGFVVTASLASHRGESLSAFLGRFYARRLARIAPGLLVMLMATTAAYVLFVPRAWLSALTESVGQAAFWGFSNWILGTHSETYFAPRAEFNPYTHTWSLGVEEQF
jgi:peptidoglycan/LPS O-acetylase OafA/YrhL